MEIVVVGIIILIGLVVGWRWLQSKRQQALEAHVKQRVAKLEHMAATRKFHEPGDEDLNPQVEYMNVTRSRDAERSDLLVFTADGIIEKRVDLSEDDLQQLAETGNWTRTADRYHTTDGQLLFVRQFERKRQ